MGCSQTQLHRDEEVIAPQPKGSTKAGDGNQGQDAGGVDDELRALLSPAPGVAPPAGSRAPAVARPAGSTLARQIAGTASAAGTSKNSAVNSSSTDVRPQLSDAAKAKAARLGIPIPSQDVDDEPYGVMDDYVDDLLGIPKKDRPAGWKAPSLNETEASLGKTVPKIIYQDGRRAPLPNLPQRERVAQQEFSQSRTTKPADASGGLKSSTPYMSGVLSGWATIDSAKETPEMKREVDVVVARGNAPAPKRRAER
eukprot:TRINITY_DN68572_c0_g1_i1.p1 TRINITY_DN68572_c0_g1~~TRINITY_DN68572_c0_g1_i1.p1  ORF type:complete len:284 (+),score=46.44 TRINITY_DN68572_c0_g1_i1:93-854(+)